ncbi:e78fdafe-4033-4a4d-a8f8-5b3655952946 [Thermothielavioides terrestris]|uniref:Uncharacterized protein n=2 Tax=Thermothielavioides terrestris TaxID=2587410 RepID=G2RAK5_THETT|nr:uncharacterized protein THITE_2118661 [Thermothielavioides terrestris NRRL 8126]AEO68883.1 hypothetical protein THITE_2118661 [Thermothielavioides terrestris NRRL 8126]SPQ22848.1 e78fdafe-4033-4a4d-a8f8-5b3655952946 [Thermothielavioides terrestris]
MGVPSQKLSFVGFHMLMTASSLGYAPATLSLMAVLARAPDDMFSRWKPQLRDVEARFKRLLQTEKTPDALTLQGLLYLRERQSDAHALRYFDHAIQAARRMSPHNPDHPHQHSPPTTHQPAGPSTRPPRWTYEGSCYLERGHILLRQGQTDEATASFRVAALELDLADGYAELAKLLPPGAPTRETYLLKAAQAGNLEACRLLALDAADKAADPARGRAERAEAATLAREWALVEPDVGRREALLAQVAERVGDATEEQRRRRSDLWKWMMSKLRP